MSTELNNKIIKIYYICPGLPTKKIEEKNNLKNFEKQFEIFFSKNKVQKISGLKNIQFIKTIFQVGKMPIAI